jgi:amidase
LKEAGAIVLAKSNMAEWAFTPYETVSSILPGYTRNPYALDRVTAGSSGGTAAAVAANFGAVGLGSDTGNSIRGPAHIKRWSGSGPRWDSPAAPGLCRSTCSPTSPDR